MAKLTQFKKSFINPDAIDLIVALVTNSGAHCGYRVVFRGGFDLNVSLEEGEQFIDTFSDRAEREASAAFAEKLKDIYPRLFGRDREAAAAIDELMKEVNSKCQN